MSAIMEMLADNAQYIAIAGLYASNTLIGSIVSEYLRVHYDKKRRPQYGRVFVSALVGFFFFNAVNLFLIQSLSAIQIKMLIALLFGMAGWDIARLSSTLEGWRTMANFMWDFVQTYRIVKGSREIPSPGKKPSDP